MRILVRILCCAYIIFYVIIPLIRDVPEEESSMSPTFRFIVIAAFIAITAVIIIVSIIEVVRNWKAGLYKASAYTDDEIEGIVEENSELDEDEDNNAELDEDEDEGNSE